MIQEFSLNVLKVHGFGVFQFDKQVYEVTCFQQIFFAVLVLVPAKILDCGRYAEVQIVRHTERDGLYRHILVVVAANLCMQCVGKDYLLWSIGDIAYATGCLFFHYCPNDFMM